MICGGGRETCRLFLGKGVEDGAALEEALAALALRQGLRGLLQLPRIELRIEAAELDDIVLEAARREIERPRGQRRDAIGMRLVKRLVALIRPIDGDGAARIERRHDVIPEIEFRQVEALAGIEIDEDRVVMPIEIADELVSVG